MFSVSGEPSSSMQRGYAPERMDLQVLRGLLLALGEVHALGVVLLAAFFEHDVGRHRARAGCVVKRQHWVES